MAAAAPLPDVLPPVKPRRGFIGFLRRNPTIAVGGGLLLLMLFVAVFAPLLWTADPTALAPARRTREPSATYWFGTDMLGRDVYSRVLYGARVSLLVGFSVAVLSSVIGLTIGLVSGFVRWADGIVMRIMDGMMSIPPILLAIALMALTRGLGAERHHRHHHRRDAARLAPGARRGAVPARAALCGRGGRRRHAHADDHPRATSCPTPWRRSPCRPPTSAPRAMIVEAILSFIGAGTPPIIPSWGNIMAEGRALWQVKPYIVFFPAIFLSITVLAVNLLGDGLRDALDPRMAKRL